MRKELESNYLFQTRFSSKADFLANTMRPHILLGSMIPRYKICTNLRITSMTQIDWARKRSP
jgi:hypothetical protein